MCPINPLYAWKNDLSKNTNVLDMDTTIDFFFLTIKT